MAGPPSWPVACEKMGLRAMDENEFYGFAGKPLPDIVGALHQSQKGCAPSAEFVQEFLMEKKVAHAAHEAGVDASLREAPDWVAGEICIGGDGLAEARAAVREAAGSDLWRLQTLRPRDLSRKLPLSTWEAAPRDAFARRNRAKAGVPSRESAFALPPDLRTYTADLTRLLQICSDAAVNSFCYSRLKKLEARFHLHVMEHELAETTEQRAVRHRDFYNIRKVDTHVHLAVRLAAARAILGSRNSRRAILGAQF